MKIMQLSKRKGETGGAPREAHLMGKPHMLAYINEAERQMLKRAGGAEAPGPEGIPVYGFWGDVWSEITSGGAAQTETFNGGSSNNSLPKTSTSTANANKQAAESMKSVGVTSLSGHSTDNDDNNKTVQSAQPAVANTTPQQGTRSDAVDKILVANYGWKMGPNGDAVRPGTPVAATKTSTSVGNANKGMAESMLGVGVLNTGGKVVPAPPDNPGNSPILEYDGSTGKYKVVGALDSSKPASVSTNADGSLYYPTDNAVNNANVRGVNDLINTGDDGGLIRIDAPNGPGGTVTYTNGNGVTIAGAEGAINTINADGDYTAGGGSTVTSGGGGGTTTTGGGGGGGTPAPPPVNQALLDALARRDAALSTQMGNIGTAFGFSNDDYYNQLGTDYREGGLSEAFTTAYDDATRGIYDTFKSAGMLTQQGVDDSMGILASAEGGEEGRIDGIVNQYTTANRNFVNDGRTGMEGTLQGFVTDTQDIPTIDAETAQIMGYDVAGNSQPFKTPKEQEVVDFFTDFVKRSYDPSYNVDPTAVASGGPSRVSGSVDQLGAGTQPSTIAGILDPISGGSVKVIG
jgi:hypothetical protein